MYQTTQNFLETKVIFRVTEQPFKVPYYAVLIRLLHDRTVPAEDSSINPSSLGRQVLEDIWKGFQAYLDKLSWRDTRLCVSKFTF